MRKRNRDKVIGGRAAVTRLHPGREPGNPDAPSGGILAILEGMTLLGAPPRNGTVPQEAKP